LPGLPIAAFDLRKSKALPRVRLGKNQLKEKIMETQQVTEREQLEREVAEARKRSAALRDQVNELSSEAERLKAERIELDSEWDKSCVDGDYSLGKSLLDHKSGVMFQERGNGIKLARAEKDLESAEAERRPLEARLQQILDSEARTREREAIDAENAACNETRLEYNKLGEQWRQQVLDMQSKPRPRVRWPGSGADHSQ
jgi:chromosome segregation ATPase